jgi:hypothetical protein
MTQEMTSFVVRFVREVSEEQEARWRGLIQHVQSGAERNFATFTDAVQFMQDRVVQNTMQALDKAEKVAEKNLFSEMAGEMTKMWGEIGPQMMELWTHTAEQFVAQSGVVRSHIDQAVAATLKASDSSSGLDQDAILANLSQLNDKLDQMAGRVDDLEKKLAALRPAQKRRPKGKRAMAE